MIYHLALILKKSYFCFNVFHYVSVRAIASLLSTLLCSFVFGNWFIAKSQIFFRSKARAYTPESHKQKDDLPTMGGIFILMVVIVNSLLWCDLSNPQVWIFLLSLVLFGALGAWDDWEKIRRSHLSAEERAKMAGISARTKFNFQLAAALLVIVLWLWIGGGTTTISFPFFKSCNPDLGLLFVPWAVFVIVALSNAVNLTDGLDGLAVGSLIPNFATFGIIAYLAGNYNMAQYLHIPFAHTAELAIIGAILMGASIGFLWYNTYPAQIFMGDVGSLALGAGLGFMALMAKQELLLPIAGGLFVVETVTVILQVLSFKYRGKRIFKMAPIHHHFELLGWAESKITMRFAIISFILCLLALITLKMR